MKIRNLLLLLVAAVVIVYVYYKYTSRDMDTYRDGADASDGEPESPAVDLSDAVVTNLRSVVPKELSMEDLKDGVVASFWDSGLEICGSGVVWLQCWLLLNCNRIVPITGVYDCATKDAVSECIADFSGLWLVRTYNAGTEDHETIYPQTMSMAKGYSRNLGYTVDGNTYNV